MVDYYEMGKRVRLRRMENHMTQEQLSELCEVSNNHISSIEKGTHHPSLNLMKNLSDSLNTSLDLISIINCYPKAIMKELMIPESHSTSHKTSIK